MGNALDAISGLSLTAPNYSEAVSILEKRFGNKQCIVAKHMDALMNIEAVTSQHNLRALRRLYDNVESDCTRNHTLQIPVMLLHTLMPEGKFYRRQVAVLYASDEGTSAESATATRSVSNVVVGIM